MTEDEDHRLAQIRLVQIRQMQMQQAMQAQSDWITQQQKGYQPYLNRYQNPYDNAANVQLYPPRDLYIAGARYDGMTGQLKRRTP